MTKLFTVSVLIAALVNLTGCATKPITVTEVETVEVVRYELVPIPDILLRPCVVSLDGLNTNADLERVVAESVVALRECTADKEAIRNLE